MRTQSNSKPVWKVGQELCEKQDKECWLTKSHRKLNNAIAGNFIQNWGKFSNRIQFHTDVVDLKETYFSQWKVKNDCKKSYRKLVDWAKNDRLDVLYQKCGVDSRVVELY